MRLVNVFVDELHTFIVMELMRDGACHTLLHPPPTPPMVFWYAPSLSLSLCLPTSFSISFSLSLSLSLSLDPSARSLLHLTRGLGRRAPRSYPTQAPIHRGRGERSVPKARCDGAISAPDEHRAPRHQGLDRVHQTRPGWCDDFGPRGTIDHTPPPCPHARDL